MKYCAPYSKNFQYKKEVDELIFLYGEKYNQNILPTLLNKAEEYKNQRIIIKILDLDYFFKWKTEKALEELKQKQPELNFTILFHNYSEELKPVLKLFKEKEIPFFFEARAADWETLHGLINLGVSDVYIVEGLGFELDKVHIIAQEAGIMIRTYANVCQTPWPQGDSLKAFFIRPEDVPIYEKYIDVLEFYGDTNIQEVMYKAYAIQKKWFGDLRELIIGLKVELDSRSIMPIFATRRAKCERVCLKGGKCDICNKIKKLSHSLQENSLYFKRKN